ncbi:MAG: hypothetical protein HFJ34_06735 [Clostridia bacterium]|nr:hypothetical protein [Clostridia bacterium]
MILSDFNFKDFFDKKNLYHHQRVKEYGIGATSIITPTQAITKINEPDLLYRIPGLGHHHTTEVNIAKKILGVRENINQGKDSIPKGLHMNDFSEWLKKKAFETMSSIQENDPSNSIEDFLNNVVKIYYVSHVNFHATTIKLPLLDSKYSISSQMYEGILEILRQLKDAKISCDSISIDGISYVENYEEIKEYLNGLIDPNFIFPFEEKIMQEQQIVQEDREER